MFLFTFSCKQANNGKKPEPAPEPSNEITITIKGDVGLEVKKPNSFNVKKNSIWKGIKQTAKEKITLKENQEIKEWRVSDVNGEVLEDAFVFAQNTTIYATSKKNEITITVAGDSGINIHTNNAFGAKTNATWGNIKDKAVTIATAKEYFELHEWHLQNATGELLKDETKFEENGTVFATSKRKVVKYMVEHLQENVNDNEYSRVDNDTEEKNGEAGKKTYAKAREYDGFETQTITQKTIKADGTTVVQIKYKRKVVSLIIDLAGGTTTTELENKSGKTLLSGKYGASVTIEVPTKNKHEFDRWNPALPANFPKENDTQNTYQALWKPLIQINIYGDERLDVTSPIEFSAFDGITWENVKAKVEKNVVFKSDWSNGDYEIYDWKTEDGSLIRDNTSVIDEMKVYIRTNYAKFKWDENKPTELIDYEGEKPRGKIIIPAKTTKMKSKIFKDCSEITDVDIAECEDIIQLDLRGTGIREIDLTVCPKLKYFHFGDCKKLEKVIARNLKEVDTLQDFFSGCTALKHIDLTGCDKLKYIGGLAWAHYHFKECTALETLNLTGCSSLKKIDLADTTVKKLIGIQCQKAEEINLSNCKNLEEIDLRTSDLVISIDYGGRYKITKLNFSGSVNAVVMLPKAYFGDSLPRGIFGNNPSNYCKQVRVLSPYYKNIVKNTGYPENRIEIYTP